MDKQVSATDKYVARALELLAQQPAGGADGDGSSAFLRRLCGATVEALSASGAGVTMMSDDGVRSLTVASGPVGERVVECQLLLGEGPGVDAFTSRRAVLVPDFGGDATSRWPIYTPAVVELGVRAVFAFPMQIGAARLGVLEVSRARPGQLSTRDLGYALTFADIAVTGLLNRQANAPAGTAADGMDGTVERRAEVFQAQGMIMVQLGVSLIEALARLRAHAYAQDRELIDVARDVIANELRFESEHREPL